MPIPHPLQEVPPRPQNRPACSRGATACFWAVLLLFFASIGYLGLLAFTRNAGQAQPHNDTGEHLVFGLLLVAFAVATVFGVIASRYKHSQSR